jgi:hypothetical protein
MYTHTLDLIWSLGLNCCCAVLSKCNSNEGDSRRKHERRWDSVPRSAISGALVLYTNKWTIYQFRCRMATSSFAYFFYYFCNELSWWLVVHSSLEERVLCSPSICLFDISSFYLSQSIYNNIAYLYRQYNINVMVIFYHTDFCSLLCPLAKQQILSFFNLSSFFHSMSTLA